MGGAGEGWVGVGWIPGLGGGEGEADGRFGRELVDVLPARAGRARVRDFHPAWSRNFKVTHGQRLQTDGVIPPVSAAKGERGVCGGGKVRAELTSG